MMPVDLGGISMLNTTSWNSGKQAALEKVTKAINDFGKLVREHRIKNGLSLYDLSLIVGYTPSYIWRIENNDRNPSVEVRVKILTIGMGWDSYDIQRYIMEYTMGEKAE